MSVTWRRLGHFVASWIGDDAGNTATAQNLSLDADTRRAGIARLHDAFRAAGPQEVKADEAGCPELRPLYQDEACHRDGAVRGSRGLAGGRRPKGANRKLFLRRVEQDGRAAHKWSRCSFIRSYEPGTDEATLPAGPRHDSVRLRQRARRHCTDYLRQCVSLHPCPRWPACRPKSRRRRLR